MTQENFTRMPDLKLENVTNGKNNIGAPKGKLQSLTKVENIIETESEEDCEPPLIAAPIIPIIPIIPKQKREKESQNNNNTLDQQNNNEEPGSILQPGAINGEDHHDIKPNKLDLDPLFFPSSSTNSQPQQQQQSNNSTHNSKSKQKKINNDHYEAKDSESENEENDNNNSNYHNIERKKEENDESEEEENVGDKKPSKSVTKLSKIKLEISEDDSDEAISPTLQQPPSTTSSTAVTSPNFKKK